ncbi:MAG TPA: hypothetical protein ENI92_01920 [Bacteroidetes bacterium]|nr:hypothetical protein [Bacteroidota bacterium]
MRKLLPCVLVLIWVTATALPSLARNHPMNRLYNAEKPRQYTPLPPIEDPTYEDPLGYDTFFIPTWTEASEEVVDKARPERRFHDPRRVIRR